MLNPEAFFNALQENGIENFSGVPDSLLKHICAYISEKTPSGHHEITANEGSAISLAVGQYLATGKIPLVYLQNSGLGNAINPLLSIADPLVYGVPIIMLIGWRGEPGVKDEPQHIKQGKITRSLLEVCDIPVFSLTRASSDFESIIAQACKTAVAGQTPVAILVGKDTFDSFNPNNRKKDLSPLNREDVISTITNAAESSDVFVSTTGMPSRELFEIRVRNGQSHESDFLTVGSMGHASMIALGIARNSSKHVFCIDGDGACLMHMGNMTTLGQSQAEKLIHVVLNNAAHDSVGGQPTCADAIDMPGVAKACGYKSAVSVDCEADLEKLISSVKFKSGPHFIEVKIKKGARSDLGRPTSSPAENKIAFMNWLNASK